VHRPLVEQRQDRDAHGASAGPVASAPASTPIVFGVVFGVMVVVVHAASSSPTTPAAAPLVVGGAVGVDGDGGDLVVHVSPVCGDPSPRITL
jgi:hypothetical protein